MPPGFVVEYEANEDLCARVTEAFIRVRGKRPPLDVRFWRAMGILLLCALGSAALAAVCYRNDLLAGIAFVPEAFVGLFGGALLLVVVAVVAAALLERFARRTIRRRLVAQLPDSFDRSIRWNLTEESFRVRTAEKDRETPWNSLRRLVIDPEFWFFLVDDGTELILPAAILSDDLRQLIRRKAANLSAATPPADPVTDKGADVPPGTNRERRRNLPVSRFLGGVLALGAALFVLQTTNPGVFPAPDRNLVLVAALAFGFTAAVGLAVKRALRPRR
jgi:hypothetical protein